LFLVVLSGTVDDRARQLARLPEGEKSPTPRRALAMAKAYQAAADASSTLRAYAADLANFKAWCEANGFQPMPATPETVGAYLAAAGLGYAMPTLRQVGQDCRHGERHRSDCGLTPSRYARPHCAEGKSYGVGRDEIPRRRVGARSPRAGGARPAIGHCTSGPLL
jgi:hypothetical protein